MTITKIDRDTCRLLQADIAEALKSVATKHGIAIRPRGGSYSDSNYTLKVECAVIGNAGVAETKERTDFPIYARSFGLKPEWLDKTFQHSSGKTFTIIGLSVRKRTLPVNCKNNETGKVYVFSTESIKSYMAKQEEGDA